MRVDGAAPRGFLRFLSLTALRAEGGGLPSRAMLIKSALRDLLPVSYSMISILVISRYAAPPLSGCTIGRTFGVRVQRVQRVRPAFGRLVQRVADCPSGNAYKVSVTGFTFGIIWQNKHYDDQPPPVAFPPFGALRHHLPPAERWDNKDPQSIPFISSSQHNGAL